MSSARGYRVNQGKTEFAMVGKILDFPGVNWYYCAGFGNAGSAVTNE